MWTDSALPQSNRIVAKEVFKLYFGGDASRVWNYLNCWDILNEFTSNGRTVTAVVSGDGSLTLKVGHK